VRSGIVVAQIALALVLLVGAGLLLRSLLRLTSESPGFDSAGVVVARVALEPGRYEDAARRARYVGDAIDRLAAVPGVERVGAIDYLPFGRSDAYLNISIEGRATAKSDDEVAAHLRSVAGMYFPVMRIRLLAGRLFGDVDGPSAAPVAVINSAMARKYWPNENAAALLGRRVRVGTSESDGPWLTIVGVVGNVKHWNLAEEFAPELYQPQAQSPSMTLNFVVRPDQARRLPLGEAMRAALAATDASQAVSILRLDELVSGSTAQSRFRAILFGFSAALAVVLAVVGIYGVIAYRVSQRTREIGVRLALGARRADILMLILRQGIGLTVAGVAIGLVASFWLSRLLQGMLFRVTTTDAATYLGVSILLIATALLSNLIPARRASRVSPVTAMRVE
jgi:putative ABC transport system permease protein